MPSELLNEDVYDVPIKTQVTENFLVTGGITEPRLRAFLTARYGAVMGRTGFKYHPSPTAAAVYVYTSKEHAQSGGGQWIAMLSKSSLDPEPRITVDMKRYEQMTAPPTEKDGLTEEMRKAIWAESISAERRSTVDAAQRYPTPDPMKGGYTGAAASAAAMKQAKYSDELMDKYKAAIRKKYRLKPTQFAAIEIEGLKKSWSLPK